MSQLVPIPEQVISYNYRDSKATLELVFTASLPGLGFVNYLVTKTGEFEGKGKQEDSLVFCGSAGAEGQKYPICDDAGNGTINIGNDIMKVYFDTEGCKMKYVTDGSDTIPFRQKYTYYPSFAGDNQSPNNRSSGHFVFRPATDSPVIIEEYPQFKIYKGSVVEEIQMFYDDAISQLTRVYNGAKEVEFVGLIKQVPLENLPGKEIVISYLSDLRNDGVFYSSSNGKQIMARIKNDRPQFEAVIDEKVAGNFYPTYGMGILKEENSNKYMTLFVERPMGVSSNKDGNLDMFVDRHITTTDGLGIDEPLLESEAVRGTHWVTFGKTSDGDSSYLSMQYANALRKHLIPRTFFSNMDNIPLETFNKMCNRYSILKKYLPVNINILTLYPVDDCTIILRLENFMPESCSKPTNVDLNGLFTDITVTNIHETALGADIYIEDVKRFSWLTDEEFVDDFNTVYTEDSDYFKNNKASNGTSNGGSSKCRVDSGSNKFTVSLSPLEIRTFLLTVKYKY